MKIIHKIVTFLNRYEEEKTVLYNNSTNENIETNLYVLQWISLTAMGLMLVISFMTPFIFQSWKISEIYVLFLPAMFLFYIFAYVCRKKDIKNYVLTQRMCILFCVVLYSFIIVIDVLITPGGPSSFFGLIMVIIPILFVFRMREIYPIQLMAVIVFIVMVMRRKQGVIASSDIFNAIVAFLFSLVTGIVVMRIRIEDKNLKLKYKQLSTIDALTGVLNKMSCENNIMEYLKHRETSVGCGLIIMDIDNFKKINDEFGHQVGDDVLEKMGMLLTHHFRATDIIGRIGGDEFMVLARNIDNYEILEKKCSQLQDDIRKEMKSLLPIPMSISLGIVILSKDHVSFEKVFQMADDALYEAKSFGKGRYVLQIMQSNTCRQKGKEIMIVADDCEADREILRGIFQDEYHIIEACDGTETLSVLSQYREEIAVMILDIEMPGMDGYQVLNYVKERSIFSEIPVIVATAEASYEEKALSMGAKDVIIKPFDVEIAKLRVKNIVK
ncbi:MAG: diguanylate cyclase [Lachnospiraceae bacterium]|nr:diguanylate cyclase [Lachnospiraceae bacterium]